MSLEVATAIELDPALLMVEVGMTPDPWQAHALRSESPRLLILAARQLGKSSVAALIALHGALFDLGALILLVSRTERQSLELLRKVRDFFHQLGDPVPLTRELESCLELANGSRVIALPGDPVTIRGFSAPRLIIIDEAGWVEDALYTALLPMVATSGGRVVVASTPSGRLGFFAAQAKGEDEDWERVVARASECPRMTVEFLDGERKRLGERNYTQEYECAFLGQGGAVFRRITDAIDRGRTETSIVTNPRLSFGIGVDVGRHNDATIITIVDSNGVQHYWERITECSYPRQIEAIKHSVTVLQELADKNRPDGSNPVKLQEAAICIDATGIGDPIYDALIYDGVWVVPYTLRNLSKKGLIDRLAAAFDNGKIRLMDIETQEQELLAFEVQKTPTGLERMGAPPGQYDDCVISLALAYHAATNCWVDTVGAW